MAKKYKLTKNGETIYPCSTTDAIVNPNTKKTVTEEIIETNANIGLSFFTEVTYSGKGNTIIKPDGTFSSYAGGQSTNYIEVGEERCVSIRNLITTSKNISSVAVAFYTESKNLISVLEYPKEGEVVSFLAIFPDNCKYYAVSRFGASGLVSDGIAIYKNISSQDIVKIRTKADVGSIFGAQKVEADGSDTKLIFSNTFKEGDIIHLVDVKAEANTYWGLKGLKSGTWITISSRMFAGSKINRDVVIPSNIEQYDKIAIETESKLILSGYGYTITDLDLQDIEKIKEISGYNEELKTYPIIQQNVLLDSDNLINPTIVEKMGTGWWLSDYIQVNEGEIYYSNGSFYTYNESKGNITSTAPFVSGEPVQKGVLFVRAKLGTTGTITDEEAAMKRANSYWLSKKNEESKYAKLFNPYLINPVDTTARELIPHQGENLFCVGDSYTMQGAYFSALLAVTGLNKIGDTGGDGNGQSLTNFPKNIIKYKEQIIQCKFVTILGGTNDYGHGSKILGTINDCIKDEYDGLKVPILKLNEEGYYVKDDSVDTSYKVLTEEDINAGQTPQSVYAAIMTCVNIIHNWDKTITVILCSQPERLQYGSQACEPPLLRAGMNMDLLAKAMKEIHEMFGVPYYDFHSNAWTIDQVEVYMNDGTLHPNSLGGEKLGRGLGAYINSL